MKNIAGCWVDCGLYDSLLNPNIVYRIKPATVTINGVELEGPLREVPENVSIVWLLFDTAGMSSLAYNFVREMPEHKQWLEEGRIFATKEARDKYQNALVKLAMGK